MEHYLTAVLPFGGRHPDAHENLVNHVLARLARNARLRQELHAGSDYIWRMEPMAVRAARTIPIDHERICALFGYIARALAWFHWSIYLNASQVSKAMLLSRLGREYFARMFMLGAARRVENSLGNGAVEYVGTQAKDPPQLTLWRIRFYGGIQFAGDPDMPDDPASEIGAITGSRRIVAIVTGNGRARQEPGKGVA